MTTTRCGTLPDGTRYELEWLDDGGLCRAMAVGRTGLSGLAEFGRSEEEAAAKLSRTVALRAPITDMEAEQIRRAGSRFEKRLLSAYEGLELDWEQGLHDLGDARDEADRWHGAARELEGMSRRLGAEIERLLVRLGEEIH